LRPGDIAEANLGVACTDSNRKNVDVDALCSM